MDTFCNCGGGNENNHRLGEGDCFRMEAVGRLIPKNFRTEGGVEMCDVEGRRLTVHSLKHQRMYHLHENGVWSLPKDMGSEISIGEEW